MASIFLSYARADADKAERIARSLEASGHSVWWDQRIDPGSVFSAEIDTAIGAADLVVVLWSASSIVSNWVKDEASVGRDNGRLVPVLIEPVQPPLGFRQYQAIDLSRSVRKLDLLHAAVARKLGEPPDVSKPQALGGGTVLRRWWLWAAAGLAMLLIGIWLFFLRPDRTVSHVVAVIAAEGGDAARSQELARTMAADLGRYRAGPLSELTLLGGSDVEARDADYRVEVGVISAANDLRADVSLLSPQDSKILWTTSVDGRADRFVDLRQQAVAKLGEVLNCAVELGDKRRSLQPEILGLYLNGCGRMNDILVSEGDETARSIFRQITQRVPDFAPAWAKLALIEVQSFPGTPPPDRPALAAEVQEHLKRARELDPTLPEVIAANAYFHPNDGTKQAHALAVLDQGLKQRPDSALLHGMRSYFLRELGRLNEGVNEANRAMQLNPLSPTVRDDYISSLAYSGRIGAAYKELKVAEAMWPGSTVLRQLRYRLDLRYGNAANALRLLHEQGKGDINPIPMDTAWQAFLTARIDPAPAKTEKAVEAFRARYRRDMADIPGYLQALGTFGRVDEAYEVVKPAETLDSMFVSTETLFRPHMRSIRADPRFIGLAQRLGLLAYWQKSGVWPDFCSEPQLPYDCKAEATKLRDDPAEK